MRRTACAVEAIFRSVNILDELPPACLEEIKDYCKDWNKGRKGEDSEFKKAYINMVIAHLADAKLAERRLYYGITGKVAGLEEHELKPRKADEQRRTQDKGPDKGPDEGTEDKEFE